MRGAKNYERIKKKELRWEFPFICNSRLIAGIILLFPTTFFRIFIKDTEVINLGVKIVFVTFLFIGSILLETMGGSIRGMGYSLTS